MLIILIHYTLLSLDGKDNYYLGDRLLFKVKAASKVEKTIDFIIVQKLRRKLYRRYS